MKRLYLIILLIFIMLCPSYGYAQQVDSVSNDTVPTTKKSLNIVQRFSRWRDRAQTSGFDSGYVAYPVNYRWQAKIYNDLSIDNCILHMPHVMNAGYCDVYSSTGMRDKISAGLYFRGWGLGFGKSLTKKRPDLNLSLSTYGRKIGFELKLMYNTALQSAMRWVSPDTTTWYGNPLEGGVVGPEHIVLELNTYYIFNNKKFSYNAALSQFTWQSKSAGSVIAGLSFQANYLGYDNTLFANLYYADTMQLLTRNLLFGLGYAYNWVYGKGKWMLHASLMPMLRHSHYRRVTMHPMSSIDIWKEDSREYYYQSLAELERFAYEHVWSISAIARLAFLWNISERWVAGLVGNASGYSDGGSGGLNVIAYNWNVYLHFGFRF